MSEENHIHAHAPHEHAVEHQAHHGIGLAQSVAIFTALVAAFAAIIGFYGSNVQSQAVMLKEESVFKQTQAADEWGFYQAKKSKGHFVELAMEIIQDPKKKLFYQAELQRYSQEEKQITTRAQLLETAAQQANQKSEQLMESHHRLANAIMFLQIAISLASITVLTRKRWLFAVASLAALIGLGITLWTVMLFFYV